jgi:probable F420-dependent oxidoreductase
MARYVLGLPVRRVRQSDSPFADPAAMRDMVVRAEELGFWGVTAPDHIVAPDEWARTGGGEQWFDPFVLLSFLAAATSRIRLITHIIVMPYRSPFAVAKAVASLDRVSNGRAVFGAGSGYLQREFEILGVPFEDRGERTDEAIRVVVACWTEERPEFRGRYFETADTAVAPRPVQQPRPPIWIGGNSLRALRRTVELGDCWTPFVAEPDDIRRGVHRARELGRTVDIAAPLGRIGRDDDPAERAEAYVEAGATYLKCGFRGETPAEWLGNLERFAGTPGFRS